jgi:hypothetical protein
MYPDTRRWIDAGGLIDVRRRGHGPAMLARADEVIE